MALLGVEVGVGAGPAKDRDVGQRDGMLRAESHNQNVYGDEDAATSDASAGRHHEAEGGAEEAGVVVGIEGMEGLVLLAEDVLLVLVAALLSDEVSDEGRGRGRVAASVFIHHLVKVIVTSTTIAPRHHDGTGHDG